jgi:hypothetical protein
VDIRVPVGAIFSTYGVLLVAYALFGTDPEPRHMLAGVSVNLSTGLGMLLFGGWFLVLSRRRRSTVRPAMTTVEGRATEEREKRTGLER